MSNLPDRSGVSAALPTPLHSRTGPLCRTSNWRRWSGFLAADSYEPSHHREYHAVRAAAALFDISPLFKYRLTGPGARALADRMLTRDVTRLATGRVLYSPWCDARGKIRDDGTLQRLGEDDYRLTSAEPTLGWITDLARGLDVSVSDESEGTAALALQGPLSWKVLAAAGARAIGSPRYFGLTRAPLGGVETWISRTGYTGDLGYELWMPADGACAVWDTLIEAGRDFGIAPAGLAALDIARIEAALPLVHTDYVPAHEALIGAQRSSPFEMGLGWAVDLDKPAFVGKEALRAETGEPPRWRFCGIAIDWDSLERVFWRAGLPPLLPHGAVRSSAPLFHKSRQVGYASSRTWSPVLKSYIGLAHIEASHGPVGTNLEMQITVEHRPARVGVRVVKTPFFNPRRKRATPA